MAVPGWPELAFWTASMARPRITLMALVSSSFAMAPAYRCPSARLHSPAGVSGGEKGEAGREAVAEVAGSDRPQFTGTEAPREGEGAEELVDDTGVVVGLAEQPLAAAVAGEEQRRVGLGGGEEVAQVLVGRAGVADLELHRPPDFDVVADGDGAAALVGSHHAPHEEIAPAGVESRLVDHTPDLQRPAHELALLVVGGRRRHLEPLESGLAAELEDEVPVGLRHHVGLAHRPAALGDHGADLDATRQHHPDRPGVDHLVVEHQTVAARLHGRRRQPTDDLEL